MIIAPLVDNALKFARQTSEAPWQISVTAQVADDTLILTVSNSGRWVEPATDRPGTGLANLRRRLQLSGIDANLASSEGDGTVSVTLSLPAAHPASVS